MKVVQQREEKKGGMWGGNRKETKVYGEWLVGCLDIWRPTWKDAVLRLYSKMKATWLRTCTHMDTQAQRSTENLLKQGCVSLIAVPSAQWSGVKPEDGGAYNTWAAATEGRSLVGPSTARRGRLPRTRE